MGSYATNARGGGGGGGDCPITTEGDLCVGDTSGTPTRLPQGSEGQVLAINEGTVGWQDHGGGDTPITTQGDIIAGDATGAPARLPVGTDRHVIVADATQPLGVKWGLPVPIDDQGELVTGDGDGDIAVLSKGLEGQVLMVDETAGNGIAWRDLPTPTLPITTQGDVIVGDELGAGVRLPVGPVRNVITPDPLSPTGLKWSYVDSLFPMNAGGQMMIGDTDGEVAILAPITGCVLYCDSTPDTRIKWVDPNNINNLWVTLYDKSLASLGDTSLVDGANTFDTNKSIYVVNRAAAQQFGFATAGLYVRLVAGGAYSYTTGPQFYIDLLHFVPGLYDYGWNEIEVTFKISPLNQWAGLTDGHFLGVGALNKTPSNWLWIYGGRLGVQSRYASATSPNLSLAEPMAWDGNTQSTDIVYARGSAITLPANNPPEVMFYRTNIHRSGTGNVCAKTGALTDAWPESIACPNASPLGKLVQFDYNRAASFPATNWRLLALCGNVMSAPNSAGNADLLIRNLRVRVR